MQHDSLWVAVVDGDFRVSLLHDASVELWVLTLRGVALPVGGAHDEGGDVIGGAFGHTT